MASQLKKRKVFLNWLAISLILITFAESKALVMKRRKREAIDYSLVGGRRYAPDWALKKLARNGRDYSYRHPTIENANMKAANRTKEQQEEFDRNHQPHIIYTPMGGQNKR